MTARYAQLPKLTLIVATKNIQEITVKIIEGDDIAPSEKMLVGKRPSPEFRAFWAFFVRFIKPLIPPIPSVLSALSLHYLIFIYLSLSTLRQLVRFYEYRGTTAAH